MIEESTQPSENYEGCKPEGTVKVIFTTLSGEQNAKALVCYVANILVKQFLLYGAQIYELKGAIGDCHQIFFFVILVESLFTSR